MYSYHADQWILFFFIYSLIGWIWECLYVGIQTRKLVNRGFMHGPCLPIYGFGAIAILFVTLPVKESPYLVFILGMLSASLLELVTGEVMEKLFKVRYWDYRKMPLNIKGYICLPASLLWGGASILLTFILHPPLEKLILSLPYGYSELISLILTLAVGIDFSQSFSEAMDLRAILVKMNEANDQIKRVSKRIEVIQAFVMADLEEKIKEIEETGKMEGLEKLVQAAKENLSSISERSMKKSMRILHRNPFAVSDQYKEALEHFKSMSLSKFEKKKD